MDRFVSQDGMDFQYGTVNVDLKFTSDGTDATVTPIVGAGIASVAATASVYLVTFEDAYVRVLNSYGANLQAAFAAAGASDYVPIATAQASGNPLTMSFQFCKGSDGTKGQPAVGDIVHVTFRLQRFDANATAQ